MLVANAVVLSNCNAQKLKLRLMCRNRQHRSALVRCLVRRNLKPRNLVKPRCNKMRNLAPNKMHNCAAKTCGKSRQTLLNPLQSVN